MPWLPVLALLTQVAQGASCPEGLTGTTLATFNQEFASLLSTADPKAQAKAEEAGLQLSCTRDAPASVTARTFLLLGVHNYLAGNRTDVERYFKAAFAIEGKSAWDPSLGKDLEQWYLDIGSKVQDKGVVFAPETLFSAGVHLVGAPGKPPWTMTVGTFTFEAGEESAPVSVNRNALTVITPTYIKQFHAPVDGAPVADIVYTGGASARTVPSPSKTSSHDDPQATPDPVAAAPESGEYWNPPEVIDKPTTSLKLRPHLDVGFATSWMGSSEAEGAPPSSFFGLGPQAGAGLTVRVGRHLVVTPEAGFRWHTGASQATADETLCSIPEGRNTLWKAGAGVPVSYKQGTFEVGAGPAFAVGAASVSDTVGDCVTRLNGRLTTSGLVGVLAIHPRFFKAFPQVEASLLGDGDRLYLSTALTVAWEGKL